jgi:hypothetical protein
MRVSEKEPESAEDGSGNQTGHQREARRITNVIAVAAIRSHYDSEAYGGHDGGH